MASSLLLGYVWRPYTANTVWARLSYFLVILAISLGNGTCSREDNGFVILG